MVAVFERFQKLDCESSYAGSNPVGHPKLFRCSSMAERLTVNQDVVGSSPTIGAKK
jgi:hypothetical protein